MTLAADTDLDGRMTNMDPALLQLLTREIVSPARWDALRFFLEANQEHASLDEISLASGRDSATLLESLGR